MTANIRNVTDTFAVAPQISLNDLSDLAALGFKRIVNNRPDGEAPGQPHSAEFAAAAKALGLDYVHIPFQGGPGREQVAQTEAWARDPALKTLAFCRSGTRSITVWGLAQLNLGAPSETIIDQAAAAGYDLSWIAD